jgi:hypothetical protein
MATTTPVPVPTTTAVPVLNLLDVILALELDVILALEEVIGFDGTSLVIGFDRTSLVRRERDSLRDFRARDGHATGRYKCSAKQHAP